MVLSCGVLFFQFWIVHILTASTNLPKTLNDLFVFPDESSASQIQFPGSVTQVSCCIWDDTIDTPFPLLSFRVSYISKRKCVIATSDLKLWIRPEVQIYFLMYIWNILNFWTFPFVCLIIRIPFFRELMLQKGDIVYIHRQVDANWFEGEHHGRAGIFPTSYVEVHFIMSLIRC